MALLRHSHVSSSIAGVLPGGGLHTHQDERNTRAHRCASQELDRTSPP
jgi:hypothetical protein